LETYWVISLLILHHLIVLHAIVLRLLLLKVPKQDVLEAHIELLATLERSLSLSLRSAATGAVKKVVAAEKLLVLLSARIRRR
jgi:hypothetical protein